MYVHATPFSVRMAAHTVLCLLCRAKVGLERQTATSEILRVIASSLADLQPVLDAMAESAARLCTAYDASILRLDGDVLRLVAHHGPIPNPFGLVVPAIRGTVTGRTVLDRQTVHVADVQAEVEEFPEGSTLARELGHRTLLSVPLLREGVAIGAIGLRRTEVQPFTDKQVALLQTFADQAVIAIENVRLFKELETRNRDLTDALDRQTATAEILRVISRAQTDAQPVFQAIADSAQRLFGAWSAGVFRYDGEVIQMVAARQGASRREDELPSAPRRPTGEWPADRAALQRAVQHFVDVETDPSAGPQVQEWARAHGWRSLLQVPMMRSGDAIGVIAVTRAQPGGFSPAEIALLQTFADQAVIAIENVRLFKELEARNRDLTEALDRQTATAEILRVISQSQTEVQPVFDTIVDNAIRLFRAWAVAAMRSDGQLLHLIAARGGTPGTEDYLRRQSPWPIQGPLPASRCVAHRTLIHIPDAESDPTLDQGIRDLARTRGWQSVLAAPMLRDGQPIGAITVTRAEPGPFSSAEVELLQTFADQAVIAVENARLLGELRARTSELTRSVQELTALGDVSRALSSTLDLDAILQTIVTRASELAGTDACSVFEYDAATEAFHLRATNNLDEEVVTLARQTPTRKGEGVQGRMALTRQPVQVPDIAEEDAYHGPLRDILLRTGTRAVLAIPMLREEELIGGLTVNKRSPGEFSSEVIELLTTFATQSALAIQNARLFREIADKSRQLEAASQHKSEFLANMSHELRTPLNAIIGFSEVLTERMFGELNDKQEEYLKDIYASGQHLLSLINDILDLSKIEAGRMELEPAEFDLPSAIENALILVRERAGRRGIALGRSIDERVGVIHADERKVKQVLLNLLSNALKFTPEGGRVDVRATVVDGMAEVSVTDTGVGIAPEDQEAVFEEFRQVGTADKKVEGTGLGLSLARKFIELHGGRIWVKSEVGRGSTFTFTIPVRRSE
jgi:signal transduction histidine kinase